jgi:hypothetical protein
MAKAMIQRMQPNDVPQPSDKKSIIHPKIFKPQPRMLKDRSISMKVDMMPMINILV